MGVTTDQDRETAAAFEALYDRMATRLLVFVARRLQDAEAATELWAECWAAAFEGWPSCRYATDPERAERWLFGIARKRIASYYRSGAIERRAIERLHWTVPIIEESEAEELERLAGLEALRELLGDALAALPAKRRQAVQLRVVGGLSYREIAERMGSSEQAARAHVSRGLGRLASAISRTEAQELLGEPR